MTNGRRQLCHRAPGAACVRVCVLCYLRSLATKIYAHAARVVGFTPMAELHMKCCEVGVRT